MPPEAKATGVGPARGVRQRSLGVLAIAVVALCAVGVAAVVSGARFSSATMGLMAATGALLLCLRALYRIAGALMRPSVETVLEQEALVGVASHRHLREEKRRLVRAINELTFDHEMGKLSKADYDGVRELYELQAVEVMRALEDDRDLHPDLLDELQRLGVAEADAKKTDEQADEKDADEKDADEADAPDAEKDVETEAKKAEEEPDGEPAADEKPAADEAPAAAEAPAADENPAADEKPAADAAQAEAGARVCAGCETPNDSDARFCKSCGAALEEDG